MKHVPLWIFTGVVFLIGAAVSVFVGWRIAKGLGALLP